MEANPDADLGTALDAQLEAEYHGATINKGGNDDRDGEKHALEESRLEEQGENGEKLFIPVGDLVETSEDRENHEEGPRLVDEIESMCMKCEQNGITRLLLTRIPYFREVILMSFYCSHCHFKNTEVQAAGEIHKHGIKFVLNMDRASDMERQIVKSDTAIFRIENTDLEIPPGHGQLTNVEGILQGVVEDLNRDQDRRRSENPELFEKLDAVIKKVVKIAAGQDFPCTVSLDDLAGNSWIEPSPLDATSKYTRTEYHRNAQQNASLGLTTNDAAPRTDSLINDTSAHGSVPVTDGDGMDGIDIFDGAIASHNVQCPGCGKDASLNIQQVKIPYFREVFITAVVCDHCGYRSNDVKTGGNIPSKGQRIWLEVHGPEDLRRDILKSETCCLKVPECNVEVQPGTMGGRFTTVEGLLTQIRDDLRGSIFDVDDVGSSGGDSMPAESQKAWKVFFDDLDKAIRGETTYTILMEDPLANSYIQSMTAPMPDPQIRTEDYDRTADEEEDLGLTDMRTHMNTNGDSLAASIVDLASNGKTVPFSQENVPHPDTTAETENGFIVVNHDQT